MKPARELGSEAEFVSELSDDYNSVSDFQGEPKRSILKRSKSLRYGGREEAVQTPHLEKQLDDDDGSISSQLSFC